MITRRVCVYPKDIHRITGRSMRYSQAVFQKMKQFFGKNQYQAITVKEFADFSGIPEAVIRANLD